MLTAERLQNDSIFLTGRADGAELQNPNSLFSVQMDASNVADQIWLVVIRNCWTGTTAYAEVLKSSQSDLTIEEFFTLCIDEWQLLRVEKLIWEEDF